MEQKINDERSNVDFKDKKDFEAFESSLTPFVMFDGGIEILFYGCRNYTDFSAIYPDVAASLRPTDSI